VNATRWNRREVLGGVLAAGALSSAPFRSSLGQQPAGTMTERSELLIRNAYVLTMDAATGDIAGGDVHMRGGNIAAVGRGLTAPGAQIIDGAGMLVLPGLVETHWHIWTALLRSLAGDTQEHGYFPTSRTIGTFYSAEDMYAAGRLAAAEAINSGVTFVHDWCHNVRGPDYAEAALRALAETGIRARFSYGSPTAASNDATIDLRDLRRLSERWRDHANGGLLTLGLAWRGAASAATMQDYELAKQLGLPISVHANNFESSAGGIQQLADRGLLAPGMQVIHAVWCTPEEIRALADNGAVFRAPHRLRAADRRQARRGRRDGRSVGRHDDAFGQRRHVRDHEGDSEHRERPGEERVRAHGSPRAPARDDRRRTLDGDRRPRRLVDAGQAGRRHHG
jgi:hypothetical protein